MIPTYFYLHFKSLKTILKKSQIFINHVEIIVYIYKDFISE